MHKFEMGTRMVGMMRCMITELAGWMSMILELMRHMFKMLLPLLSCSISSTAL